MNLGFAFIVLFAIIGAVFGTILIASSAQNTANVDTFGRVDTVKDNLTRSNVTALAPVGITAMGYVAIIVAVLIVVSAAVVIIVAMPKGGRSSRW